MGVVLQVLQARLEELMERMASLGAPLISAQVLSSQPTAAALQDQVWLPHVACSRHH